MQDDAESPDTPRATAGTARPARLDVDRRAGLTVTWDDGTSGFYPVAHLRRLSPSADAKALREEMARNPLTVLPAGKAAGPLTIEDAELVGNYAVRLRFSDGHASGIYSWTYLRSIDPGTAGAPR